MIEIPGWMVGFFFGALTMGFLSLAALTAASRYLTKRRAEEEQ